MVRSGTVRVLMAATCGALVVAAFGGPPAAGAAAGSTLSPEIRPTSQARPVPIPKPKPKRGPGLTQVVQPGPASPISPDIDSYYYALRSGECAQVLERTAGSEGEVTALYAALADLCLGYLKASYQVDWDAAEKAYADSIVVTDCLSIAARDGLGRALERHRASGKPRPSFGTAPTGTACAPEPTFVGLVSHSDGTPDSLVVLGLRLFEAMAVKVDGDLHEATSRNAIDGTECARVDVPGVQAATGDTVLLRVRGNGYKTPLREWTVGPVVSEDDFFNLDSTLCVPAVFDDGSSDPATNP